MPEPCKPKKPVRENILFFAVFIVIGLLAFSFPLFTRIIGAGGMVALIVVRHFLVAGIIIWGVWRFFHWLRSGGERRDR